MSFAATLPWSAPPIYRPRDRSLGTEADDLRESLNKTAAPAIGDRESEILSRVLGAVEQSEASDGTTVLVDVFVKTLEFMTHLPSELPLPVVVIESESEIGLDWDEDDQRVVSLTIDSSNQVGLSALFGREPLHGRVECIDGFPETLRYVLARLYPSARLG